MKKEDIVKMVSGMSPNSLVDFYKRAIYKKDAISGKISEREIIHRLMEYKKATGSVYVSGSLPYPGDTSKDHPFETQLVSRNRRKEIKGDLALAVHLFSSLCDHTLYKDPRVKVSVFQTDLMMDVYSATPERLSSVIARAAGMNDERYFCDHPKVPRGVPTERAINFIESMGWKLVKTESIPLLT